jgi:hypothetical protein
MVMKDERVTVGGLRNHLANFHDAEGVVIAEGNLLYKVTLREQQTAIGTVVVLERGDKVVW